MDFLVEQTSEKVVMMGWMSAGRAASTGLLRERERMHGKMALLPCRTRAATGSTVMWNFQRKSIPRMGPSTSPVMKVKLHCCIADWLSFRQRVRGLPLRTSGYGHTIGGGEQATLWRSWTRYQGH